MVTKKELTEVVEIDDSIGFDDLIKMGIKQKEKQMIQLNLPLIKYEQEGELIYQRAKDGYVNATAMCKACNKEFKSYNRLESTKEFVKELSSVVQIPHHELIQSIQGGIPQYQGTWVHPQVAMNLAQWLSPKFAVKVSQWVCDWLSGVSKTETKLPYHLRRYMVNMTNVPIGHFSMLNEVTISLIAPLEQLGYIVGDKMIPDISLGKTFSSFLRKKGVDVDSFPKYEHKYEDGRTVFAKAYPNEYLSDMRNHFIEVWLVKKSRKYFTERDKKALPYLEQLFQLPNYREVMGYIETK